MISKHAALAVLATIVGSASAHADTPSSVHSGTETVLYSFEGGSDGANPDAELIADDDGNLYGSAGGGGSSCQCGTVFKLAPDGAYSVLYAFRGSNDGFGPGSALLTDISGNLYGSTTQGGSTRCGGYGCGTIFRLAPDGTETVLYAFRGGRD